MTGIVGIRIDRSQVVCIKTGIANAFRKRPSISIAGLAGLAPFTRQNAPAAIAVHATWPSGASTPRSTRFAIMLSTAADIPCRRRKSIRPHFRPE